MATYIPGMTDYIPQIQEFRPDFNFYAKSLQMSQSKYDANHERLSNLYGSLLNSPMLREKNIEERDQFFKVIDQDIKKMSSMDLSKQQNVDAASSVFNQLLDNDNIVKDMVWTKNWQKEHQRAEGFRNCVDPKKCGGSWWEGGVTALNYMADEFKTASDDEALNFGNAKFTPYQDVMDKAKEIAKAADLSIKIDQKKGGYIVTTKNGMNLMQPLQSLFLGTLGRDPKIKEYYKTKAYVDRKNWINSKIPEYGSPEAAREAYMTEITNKLAPQTKKDLENMQLTKDNADKQRKILEDKIRTQGTTSDSPLADVYRQMVSEEEQYNSSLAEMEEADGNMNVAMANRTSKAAMANLDNVLANSYLQDDINAAAYTMAFKDYEETMKADPFAVENARQANRLALEKVRFQNKKALEGYKFDLKQYAKQAELRGGLTSNVPLTQDAMVGATAITDDPQAGFKQFLRERDKLENEISAPEQEISVEAMKLTQSKSKAQGGAANDDLVRVMDVIMQEFADPSNYKENNKLALEINKDPRIRQYANMTNAQKLRFAQNFDFNKLEGLAGSVMDNIYTDAIVPMMDMTKETNQVTRDYLKPLWESSAGKRMDIKNKNVYLDNLNDWYSKQAADVKAKMRTNAEFDPYIDMIDALIDDYGNKKTKEEFAKDFAESAMASAPDQRPMIENDILRGAVKYSGAYPLSQQMVKVDKEQVYKDAYQQALIKYDGMEEENFSMPWSMVGGMILPGSGALAGGYLGAEGEVPETNIYELYKTGWSRYADPAGVPGYMKGVGSEAVEKQMVFPTVDPAESLSVATMGTNAYIKDILSANADQRRVSLSGFSSQLPGRGDNQKAMAVLQQMYNHLVTRTNPEDKRRPIFNATYQNIAGGDNNWAALNLKIDDTYAKQFVGTEKNPGLFYGQREALQQNGITMYLKKDAAKNMFVKNATKTSLDNVMDWAGQVELNDYPETAKDVLIKKKASGGYSVTGAVLAGVDAETGVKQWEPLGFDYKFQDVNTIATQILDLLAKTEPANRYLITDYLRKNGIKNPQELLNQ